MVVQVKICRRQASIAVTVGGAAAVRAVPAGCLQLVTTRQGRQGGTQPWILQSGDLVSIVSARISWPVDAYERSRLALCVALGKEAQKHLGSADEGADVEKCRGGGGLGSCFSVQVKRRGYEWY